MHPNILIRERSPVNGYERTYIVKFTAGLLAVGVTLGVILMIGSFCEPDSRGHASPPSPSVASSSLEGPGDRPLATVPWAQLPSRLDSEANVLELPKASFDFVGNWGGYTYDTAPAEVQSPDHVSVAFGRRGNTVFFATRLYSPSGQTITSKPRAWIADSREVLVTYEAEDGQLDYSYVHRFTLLDSGTMAYKETVDLYDRRTHRPVGTAGQHATLSRLTTAYEKRVFAEPSARDVLRGGLSTSRKIRAR